MKIKNCLRQVKLPSCFNWRGAIFDKLNADTDKPVMERTYSRLYQNIQASCKETEIKILSLSVLAVG